MSEKSRKSEPTLEGGVEYIDYGVEVEGGGVEYIDEGTKAVEYNDAKDPVTSSKWAGRGKKWLKYGAIGLGIAAAAVPAYFLIKTGLLLWMAKEAALGRMNWGKGFELGKNLTDFEPKKSK